MTVDEAIKALQELNDAGYGELKLRIYSDYAVMSYPEACFELQTISPKSAYYKGYGDFIEVTDNDT